MPYGLPDATLHAIRAVLAQHPRVQRATLYGSRAKGCHRNGSDIDLTLHGSDLTFDDLLRIETQLDDLDLPYLIDLSLHRHLTNPDLLQHIQHHGQDIHPLPISDQ